MKTNVLVVTDWNELFPRCPVTDGPRTIRVIREKGEWYTVVWYNGIPRVTLCSFEQLIALGVVDHG